MEILLLDMDGTLLTPRGYHLALQETITITGRSLGYVDVKLTPKDITAFEAAGVASEWDSAAICAAILLENLLQSNPEYTLPPTYSSQIPPSHNNPPPNFQAFAQKLADPPLRDIHPLMRAKRLFLNKSNDRTPEQNQSLVNILDTARQMDGSFTHRVFQELVLGSEAFECTYNVSSVLNVESYLLTYDRPNMTLETRDNLLAWLQGDDHHGVIFTSRPSGSPGKMWSVPETELGAQCVGLDTIPIAGLGGILWLSAQRDCDPLTLLKPAPVHALVGLRLALGDPLETALEKAATFVFDGSDDRSWETLQGAKVYVYEDTTAGVISLHQAQQFLQDSGIKISVFPIGITDEISKREALERVGAVVFDDLSEAFANSLNPDRKDELC
jgi:hypothetical protein